MACLSVWFDFLQDGVVVKTKKKNKKERTEDAKQSLYGNFIKVSQYGLRRDRKLSYFRYSIGFCHSDVI
jgi:hypothetical protein